MSPDWGHDIPNLISGLPYPPLRTSSLGYEVQRIINMADFPVESIDKTASTHKETNTTSSREDHRPVSLRSSSTQTSSSSRPSRRDSGYCSSKNTAATKPLRGSRTSSKQSLPSTRDTSVNHERTKRPTRHRINSASRAQTPRLNMEDALALHERSKRLFPTPSQPQSPVLGPQEDPPHSLQRTMSSPYSLTRPPSRRMQITRVQTFNTMPRTTGPSALPDFDLNAEESEKSPEDPSILPPLTIHWTSDTTRRKEYAYMDKQNRGIRGVWNKIMPKFMRSTSSKFYDENEGSDADSVRRYRLDLGVK